MNFNATGMQ